MTGRLNRWYVELAGHSGTGYFLWTKLFDDYAVTAQEAAQLL